MKLCTYVWTTYLLILGTGHYDEVPILFNVPTFKLPKNPQDPVNQFRSKLVKLWTNFAKYGYVGISFESTTYFLQLVVIIVRDIRTLISMYFFYLVNFCTFKLLNTYL